jgi:preprotein translocase subunit SecY
MPSQTSKNEHWPEEETSPPLAQKQQSTPASSWRGWSRWLQVLGVVVPLVVGLVCSFIDLSLLLVVWLPFLLGGVSAALFRSWWAVLVVPISLSMGTLLSISLREGGLPNIASTGFAEGVTLFVALGVVPMVIGAAIGAPLGKQIERRLQQRVAAVKFVSSTGSITF